MLTWLIIIAMVAVNALFVAAEFAAVSVRRSRVQQLAEDGDGNALRLLPILSDAHRLDRYIAACQIGITLSSLIVGAFGQSRISTQITPLLERFGGMQDIAAASAAAVIVLIGLTTLQMVFGELIPKSLALQFSTQVALWTVLPMRWSLKLFAGFIAVLNGSGLALLKLMGFPTVGHKHIHSPEEIDLLIADSRDGGYLEPDEQRRLHQALQLSMRPAHQLMVPRVHLSGINAKLTFAELVQAVAANPYTRLPVYEGTIDKIVGIIHTRDVALAFAEGRAHETVASLMRPVVNIPETLTADRLLGLMREKHTHQAIVIDEFGGVAGLVTLEDVLAELMGDVPDEFKLGQPMPETLPDGRVRIPGLMRLDEAEPWLGTRWDGDVDTVAGQVIQAFGYFPPEKAKTTIDGVGVEVERVVNRAIASIIVTPFVAEEVEE